MTETQPSVQQHRVYPTLYKDSVALMSISSALMDLEGIEVASVVMATPSNRENLRAGGLDDVPDAGPNDLLVAVRGSGPACEEALAAADRSLAEQPADDAGEGRREEPVTSIAAAVSRDASSTLALISVPGPYAGAEALKALHSGLDVMIFSDNVPSEQEVEVKRYAQAHDLLVMGPDCGTALVNGVPLGFANVVRRGRIGVVGASGTGIQEITTRVHLLGEGVSQALGTGSHDLSSEVGGISTLHALRVLEADGATEAIVLVSKPPAPEVAARVLEVAAELSTPVVVMFVGADPASIEDERLHVARTLAGAADDAVALVRGAARETAADGALDPDLSTLVERAAGGLAPGQQHVRGIFSGGTFCYEAQLLCRSEGITACSNTPVAGNERLADIWTSQGDTIIDMGDDDFTRGRPHPMIDPSLRDDRLRAEADDPATAVLLFDVVLGYGASEDPTTHVIEVLQQGRQRAEKAGRRLPVIAHVCGTDEDPQRRSTVVAALEGAGVMVADSNAEAAQMAAHLVATARALSQNSDTSTKEK